MRILLVGESSFIGTVKMGLGLQALGHDVIWVMGSIRQDMEGLIHPLFLYSTKAEMFDLIERIAPSCDICQTFSDPSEVAVACHLVCSDGGPPVVLRMRDADMFRNGGTPSGAELMSLQMCDGWISHGDFMHKIQAIPGMDQKPNCSLYSPCIRSDIESIKQNSIIGDLVYMGNVSGYYHGLLGCVQELCRAGISFHILPTKNTPQDVLAEYVNAGAVVHRPYGYQVMLTQLSRFRAGFYGVHEEDNHAINGTVPNKVFEYIAAGLPVIVKNSSRSAAFVKEHGIGYNLISYDMFHIPEIPRDVLRNFALTNCMETMLGPVEDMYRSIINAQGK